MSLPIDRDARNALPIWDGVMVYFPDAWGEIAKVSVLGNKQHNLGVEKLYFNRDVSTDHGNKVIRHMLDHAAGKVFDEDGTYHLAKAAWRALAALQVAIEQHNVRVNSVKEAPVRVAAQTVKPPLRMERAECSCASGADSFAHLKGCDRWPNGKPYTGVEVASEHTAGVVSHTRDNY